MEFLGLKIFINFAVFIAIGLICWVTVWMVMDAMHKYEQTYVEQTSRSLSGMFIFMDPKRLFYLNIVIMLLSVLVTACITANVLILSAVGAISFLLPRFWIFMQIKFRLSKFETQLVDTIVMMVSAMRSGMNLLQAIELVEKEQDQPTSQEFGLILREYKMGVHMEDALVHLSERVKLEDLNLLVVSLTIVMEAGGNLAEMLDTLANVIRKRKKLEGKIKSLTAQGKMQAFVVTLLPSAIGFMMYLMEPAMMIRMFTTTLGMVLIGIMITLQILGFIMIRKITTLEF